MSCNKLFSSYSPFFLILYLLGFAAMGELGTCTRASFTYSRVDIETRSGYKAELLVDKWDIDQVQILL